MDRKSELVSWSSAFSVGIKIIDDQHRELLNLVNDMFNHISEDKTLEQAYIGKIVQQAVQFVKTHFKTEEAIMVHINFPGYAEHKRAHDAFVQIVVENVKNFENGQTFVLADFTRYLKEWILTHIAIMDKQYFTYLKRTASHKPDGELNLNWDDIVAQGSI